jgi:hypothetical protein
MDHSKKRWTTTIAGSKERQTIYVKFYQSPNTADLNRDEGDIPADDELKPMVKRASSTGSNSMRPN